VDAAADHIDACEEADSLGSVVRKDIKRLDAAGETLRAPVKRELSRQLLSAATAYADTYQIGLEGFCDKALDAVAALLSPKPGDDVISLRRAASSILMAERKKAERSASQIQPIWRRLDELLFKEFGSTTRSEVR
jgi:hypothetical protein